MLGDKISLLHVIYAGFTPDAEATLKRCATPQLPSSVKRSFRRRVYFFRLTPASRASVAAPWIADGGSRTGGRGVGSSVADSESCGLIVVLVADPVSRWHWARAVDQDPARESRARPGFTPRRH
ncbi:unnamed protein product [Pleuronectes platessa]|uniref:Uncharacterized protein n=1 Tax=Pleuronectes platessa TaxID=8262 RepID=A0A9N7V7P0_PLEPL|nr:unnamed protein product [Pleuronectes platessa]